MEDDHYILKATNDSVLPLESEEIKESYFNNDMWKEIYYTIDLLTIIAFKLICEEIKAQSNNGGSIKTYPFLNANGTFNKTNASAWLSNQKIPSEYIFNTYKLNTNGSLKNCLSYSFGPSNIKIGVEINKFSDVITIPFEDGSLKFRTDENESYKVQAYKIAEIQQIFRIFEKYSGTSKREEMLKKCIHISFRVPNFNIKGYYRKCINLCATEDL